MALPRVTLICPRHVRAAALLVDIVDGRAKGKALDMTQAAPIEGWRGSVRGSTDYGAMAGSRLVVITAGLARKPGMSRDDLLAANAQIVGPIAERINASAPDALIIVVTNPLDVMVAQTLARSGFDRRRVM